MEFENHKIKEAICAFHFDVSSESNWNVGKFADFYKQIEGFGYTESQEKTPLELRLEVSPEGHKHEQKLGEMRILYTNKANTQGIIAGKAFISFHTINHYAGWNVFLPQIKQGIEAYQQIGLGKKISFVQMSFINQFQIDIGEKLSNYLNFVPDMSDFEQGVELNQAFQSDFAIDTHTFLHLQSICQVLLNNIRDISLHCNCRANVSDNSPDWQSLAEIAHLNAVKAFKSIAHENFKNKIK